MKKRILLGSVIILTVILALTALAGCSLSGNPTTDKDYVEVTELRVKESIIRLAPEGVPSKKQLSVEVVPANATNQKVTYHIPSEFVSYVKVDAHGMLTASRVTEEGVFVPVTIKSTSNAKATTVVNVIVEDVAVERLYFDEDKIVFTLGDAPKTVPVTIEPSHALDGRDVSYSSQNPDICTISADGKITPVGVGNTQVIVSTTTLSGTKIEDNMSVEVKYVNLRCKLEVTNASPQYNQTIGMEKPLTFQLVSLNLNSDPNPVIFWYIDTKEVEANRGRWSYEHTPKATTKTTYKIKVRVQPKGDDVQEYYSQPITIYQPFSGFDIKTLNSESDITYYNYLQTVEFPLALSSEGVEKYIWYLKPRGSLNSGVKVAETTPLDKNLVRKLNLDGEYDLTAVSVTPEGNVVNKYTVSFGVSRYKTGDTLVLAPLVKNDGKPPESYEWRKYECDAEGVITGEGVIIGHSSGNDYFRYKFTVGERIVIGAYATLDGIVATVGGVPFTTNTKLLKICPDDYVEDVLPDYISSTPVTEGEVYGSDIYYVVLDGIKLGDESYPFIYWNSVAGRNAYIVEVTLANGKVYMLDSDSTVNSSYFGDYSCYLPPSIATLDDVYDVRIKRKGGTFSDSYHYGKEVAFEDNEKYFYSSINEKFYDYLTIIEGNINRYMRDMREVGRWLELITLYLPTNLSGIIKGGGSDYDTFTSDLIIEFSFEKYMQYYLTKDLPTISDPYLQNVCRTIYCATSAYCETGYGGNENTFLEVEGLENTNNKGFHLGLKIYKENRELITSEPVFMKKSASRHYSSTPYGADNTNFAMDKKPYKEVYTSDQLYRAFEQGYKPLARTTATEQVLNKAKEIINSIIGPEMDDMAKVLAIYDYLTINVIYDHPVLEKVMENPNEGVYRYDAYHAEGALLYNKAVCDGIAKAFVILCGVLDIPSLRLVGFIGDTGHAWNKVMVNGVWYVVDATWGAAVISFDDNPLNNRQYTDYKFFLMTDEEFRINYTKDNVLPIIEGEFPPSAVGYDYYTQNTVNGSDFLISGKSDFEKLIKAFEEKTEILYLNFLLDSKWLQSFEAADAITAMRMAWEVLAGAELGGRSLIEVGASDDEGTMYAMLSAVVGG